jgi:hypothetical protein
MLLALSLGCGLMVERCAGTRLSGPLVLPVGFAGLVVLSLFTTMWSESAPLTAPAVVVLAVLGFLVGGRALVHRRPDWWGLAAAGGVFAVYAAPVVFSGEATFPGYIKLDDDATFLANLDRAMEHGRSLTGLEPSSYLATLQPHLAKGYPLGAVLPIGVGRDVVGGESLWLYHPAVAVTAAMLALTLYGITSKAIGRRSLRSLAAFVAAQSALLYGYAMWGGLKEVAGAAGIALVSALVWPVLKPGAGPRTVIPLAVASAWLLGVLSSGALLWLLPALGVVVILSLRRDVASGTRTVGALVGLVLVLSIPTLAAAPGFLANRIFEFDYLANLLRRLDVGQLAGIWPAGDFRVTPSVAGVTYLLIGIAALSAGGAVLWAALRGSWALPLYACGAVASCLLLIPFATPWIEGKALAMAAPAVPLASLTAAGAMMSAGRAVEGIALAALVAGGVLWSNALQYRDVWLAPRGQLAELAEIGNRYDGQGPALMTEFNPYGVRHLLRGLDAEGSSELRIRPIPMRDGRLLPKGAYTDIDQVDDTALRVYRTLILRRSPTASRPPSDYHLVSAGRWYEVWQRDDVAAPVREHVPLGNELDPAAVPDCAEIRRLASIAGQNGSLRAVERPRPIVVPLSSAETAGASVEMPVAGDYGIWLGGTIRDPAEITVDGRRISRIGAHLDYPGQYAELREVDLSAGRHQVSLRFDGSALAPGRGGSRLSSGPMIVATTTADTPVMTLRSSRAQRLCGRRLDWVEAVGS